MRVARFSSLTAALFVCAVAFSAPLATPTAAQSFGIAIQVNDDAITNVDIDQRARFIAFVSGGKIKKKAARKRAVDDLIEDALKLQEAARLGVEVTEKEIDQAIAGLAKSNKMSVDTLLGTLKKANISLEVFRRQLRADIAWRKIIRGRYGDRLKPTDGEIEAAMKNSVSKEDIYVLRQIIVPLKQGAPKAQVDAAMGRVETIRPAMTSCTTIEKVAAEFGAQGMDIGKVKIQDMPGPIRSQVANLDVGDVSQPIRSNNGVHLVMVCGVSRKGAPNRERIAARLTQEKAARVSQGAVAELRRNALITRAD